MDDSSKNNLQGDQEVEAIEETLSLSDFPVTTEEQLVASREDDQLPNFHDRRSSAEFFEFFSGSSTTDHSHNMIMSHAEDIIFCGKLIPFKQHQNQNPQQEQSLSSSQTHHRKLESLHRRRSESFSELKSTATTTARHLIRNSRSLDYKKLNRNSSLTSETTPSEIHRNSSGKLLKPPRWCVLMFGLVKFPPEMDIRDIKNRQVRRSTSKKMFPSFEQPVTDKIPVSRRDHRKRSWGLLQILSCNGSASVAVTASFECLSNA